MASGPPRRWLQMLARRVAALNPPVRHVSRFPHGSGNMAISSSGVKGEELGKPGRPSLTPSANDPISTIKDIMISVDKHFPITRGMDNEESRAAIKEFIASYGYGHPTNNEEDVNKIVDALCGDEDASGATQDVVALCSDDSSGNIKECARDVCGQNARDVSDDEERLSEVTTFNEYGYPLDGFPDAGRLLQSRHRDGSIYRDNYHWKQEFHIADRNETRLEAMMLSDPSKDCIMEGRKCMKHEPCPMFQILSFKLAKIPVDFGAVKLYGYIAARDLVDPLLNYVVNISRDDPIIVEQGSLIEMTGPKRGIELSRAVLLEYDMRIKTGDQEKDDLQLIDGVSIIDEVITRCEPFTNRIHGNYGAVDMTQMCVKRAVEATVEVVISKVYSSFNLRLSCFTSGLHDEIRLFDGVIGKSCELRRYVLAARMGTCMNLKLKVGSGSDCSVEHCRSFRATNHGCARKQIKIEFASISAKVTWSTLDFGMLKLL